MTCPAVGNPRQRSPGRAADAKEPSAGRAGTPLVINPEPRADRGRSWSGVPAARLRERRAQLRLAPFTIAQPQILARGSMRPTAREYRRTRHGMLCGLAVAVTLFGASCAGSDK